MDYASHSYLKKQLLQAHMFAVGHSLLLLYYNRSPVAEQCRYGELTVGSASADRMPMPRGAAAFQVPSILARANGLK